MKKALEAIKIVIGDRIMTEKEFFSEKEKFRRVQAGFSFEEKIRSLINLQKLALSWGGRIDVIVWKV